MQMPNSFSPPSALLALHPWAVTSPSRLQAAYSDISRQKESNPHSYKANIEWWRKALESVVRSGIQRQGDTLVLGVGPALMDLLRTPGAGRPLALAAVVNELCAEKVLFKLREFLTSRKPIYDPGWLPGRIAAYVMRDPLWWALEQLGIVGEEGIFSTARDDTDTSWWGDYVVVPLVEAAASKILTKQSEQLDTLYSLQSFKQKFCSVHSGSGILPDGETQILLTFLQRDKCAVIVDKDVIKFTDWRSGVPEITAVDRGLLELKEAVKRLHTQVSELQQNIDEYTNKASTALQQKQKDVALTYLRSKKRIELLLHKRLASLQMLQATLISIETASQDIQIVKAYESSTAALRSLLAHPSLRHHSVEETMEALADATTTVKDLGLDSHNVHDQGDVALGIDVASFEAEIQGDMERLSGLEAEIETVAKRLGDLTLKPPTEVPRGPRSTYILEQDAPPLS